MQRVTERNKMFGKFLKIYKCKPVQLFVVSCASRFFVRIRHFIKISFAISVIFFAIPGHAEIPSVQYVDTIVEALIESKANKIVPATVGNVATLDAVGNLADGGITVSGLATDVELAAGIAGSIKTTGSFTATGTYNFTGGVVNVATSPLP